MTIGNSFIRSMIIKIWVLCFATKQIPGASCFDGSCVFFTSNTFPSQRFAVLNAAGMTMVLCCEKLASYQFGEKSIISIFLAVSVTFSLWDAHMDANVHCTTNCENWNALFQFDPISAILRSNVTSQLILHHPCSHGSQCALCYAKRKSILKFWSTFQHRYISLGFGNGNRL